MSFDRALRRIIDLGVTAEDLEKIRIRVRFTSSDSRYANNRLISAGPEYEVSLLEEGTFAIYPWFCSSDFETDTYISRISTKRTLRGRDITLEVV